MKTVMDARCGASSRFVITNKLFEQIYNSAFCYWFNMEM